MLQLDAAARAYINKALASPLICCSWLGLHLHLFAFAVLMARPPLASANAVACGLWPRP